MIKEGITVLLFVSNSREAALIKQQVHRSAKSVVTLTAYSIEEFIQKLSWFPTTFIVVNEEFQVNEAKRVLTDKNGDASPLIVTSVSKEDLARLPYQLEHTFDQTADFRAYQEEKRRQKLLEQKRAIQQVAR